MALYFGGDKVRLNLGGAVWCVNIPTVATPALNYSLLSLDNYVLKDSNGLYLIPKIEIPLNVALSYDGHILKDSDNLYITIKEND